MTGRDDDDDDPDPGAYDQESRHDERAAGHDRNEAYCPRHGWYDVRREDHSGH